MPRRHGPLLDDDAASWGEMLQNYEASKKGPRPLPDEAYLRQPLVTASQKAAEARRYNPLLQTFNSSELETTAKKSEADSVVSHLNWARDRQIATESTYNILNMRDKRSGLPTAELPPAAPPSRSGNPHHEVPTFRHPLDSCYAFNIVSGLSLAEHSYKPPGARMREADAMDVPKPRLQSVTNLPRDYNVLSGKYVDSHEDKVALEKEMNRRKAAQKFCETHDYDPFTCTFYDDSKEAAQLAREARVTEEQPMKSFRRLPPSLQKGEGYVYDITTHSVKNDELLQRKKTAERRWNDSKRELWERDTQMRERGFARQDAEAQRALNRASFARYRENYGSGYSILDHRDYVTPTTVAPPSRVPAPPTLWQTLKPTASAGAVRSGGFQRVSTPTHS